MQGSERHRARAPQVPAARLGAARRLRRHRRDGGRPPRGARRCEETGLDVEITELLGVYSDPKRDPRGFHTVGMVFIARASGQPVGGDDAAEARIFPVDALPADIPFDHPLIIEDYRRYRRGLGRPPVGR